MRILVITWGSRLPRVFCCIFLCVLSCVVFIYRVCVVHHWVVIVWYLDFQLPMKSVLITTDVVSSNLDQGEVYKFM